MANPKRPARPLSPFMIGPYYRPQWTSMTSIFTRITGNALIVAALLIVWWFIAAATGPDAFARADGVLTSWFGDLVMFFSVAAIWYHSLAGIRHLIWDSGHMLAVDKSETFGQAMVLVAVLLTIFTVIVL
ncbi:succinate dehydrogenase, cytochrome b556 subunit [Loktanella sp. DJP18]|uniref:succinate dehydrogenase, cytochrome b556 subunit n=1 Tax=Loktanella sp. DJP18 TaxID=3409788 RepID=UPI003BB62992